MFGTGLRKVLGFFVSAGHAKALTTLPCSAAVSRKRVRCWGGKGEKKRLQERKKLWLHAALRAVHWHCLFFLLLLA